MEKLIGTKVVDIPKRIHLDPVGGVAGDMFIASLLDLNPELSEAMIKTVKASGLVSDIDMSHLTHSDGLLRGSRFSVRNASADHVHEHFRWAEIREHLMNSTLTSPIRARCIDIFTKLAEAEAQVHGTSVDEVTFHEVGAWDSVADIVGASFLIEACSPCAWSIGAIPLGRGRIETAHGVLPVPAPATAVLLQGLPCIDDNFPGERVTPTGAAILKHLEPIYGLSDSPMRLERVGYGFGSRKIEGLSNVLRAMQFRIEEHSPYQRDKVTVIKFEVDDQTPEDLALALDNLRAINGVLDVFQVSAIGKRGRQASGVRILCNPDCCDAVVDACFYETTTLGLRLESLNRIIVQRSEIQSRSGVGVKVAKRRHGSTAKAELRDVSNAGGAFDRQMARDQAVKELYTNDA